MVTEEIVMDALKKCYDPEIPVNVVDLGLVYDVKVDDSRVDIKMTLTATGCPMSSQISADAKAKVLAVDGVESADVEIVWEPRWSPEMITPAGRRALGME
ncbi:MAG: metal-sulfur cluster assembly factor [Lentisphaeria bacterium]|nr:metal-sulfur cluster assembly factor [Candidatus Neomarinimicrobiota bacterium]MCF7841271.1 metal-sulfur cluster assembly factor [Lentisphaeria bacterium]